MNVSGGVFKFVIAETPAKERQHSPSDAYIAVMGMTGSGKSSMIATCCPEAVADVGHALESREHCSIEYKDYCSN